MLAFIFAPFFIALEAVVLIRTIKHIKRYPITNKKVIHFLLGLLLFSGVAAILIGFLLPVTSVIKRPITRYGFYYLGYILYFFVGLAIALILRGIYRLIVGHNRHIHHARQYTLLFVVLFSLIMSTYGILNAHDLKTTHYDVTINKKANVDEMNVVLLADLHLGYNVGVKEVKDMVEKINACNPDMVVIAGDIFDNEYEALQEPEELIKLFKQINAKYKYCVYGNHDIQEKILVGFTFGWNDEDKPVVQSDERMNEFIKKSGFTLLYDSYALLDEGLYVYGRPDASKINLGNTTRIEASNIAQDMNKELPIIVIDHQPSELLELAQAGVDVDLSGHTHDGQVWPGTLTINLLWENACGMIQVDNMYSIVTSGAGLFGVNMRTGCKAEIVDINIKFKNS